MWPTSHRVAHSFARSRVSERDFCGVHNNDNIQIQIYLFYWVKRQCMTVAHIHCTLSVHLKHKLSNHTQFGSIILCQKQTTWKHTDAHIVSLISIFRACKTSLIRCLQRQTNRSVSIIFILAFRPYFIQLPEHHHLMRSTDKRWMTNNEPNHMSVCLCV